MAKKAIDQPKRKMGRPSLFTQQVADTICERLVKGDSLRSICEDPDLPCITTVMMWLRQPDRADFLKQYTRAREIQAETMAEEILEIADNATNDWMERNGQNDPGWAANGENVQRSRLRVEARKWLASKLLPKKYGEKVDVEHSGDVRIMMQPGDDKL